MKASTGSAELLKLHRFSCLHEVADPTNYLSSPVDLTADNLRNSIPATSLHGNTGLPILLPLTSLVVKARFYETWSKEDQELQSTR